MTDPDTSVAVDPSLMHNGSLRGVLGDIGARRDAIRSAQVKEFWVPRWGPTDRHPDAPRLKIVCGLVSHDDLRRAAAVQERAAKEKSSSKSARIEVDTNADIIIKSTLEVVAVMPDGTEVGMGPDGARTRFDSDLAIALGLDPGVGARATCVPPTGIFINDADLLATSKALGEWSGYREDSIDSDTRGES